MKLVVSSDLCFLEFLQNWLKYKIPHMEVLNLVIRNLLTCFGDHSSQTPLVLGIFMHLNIVKRNTYNYVRRNYITFTIKTETIQQGT